MIIVRSVKKSLSNRIQDADGSFVQKNAGAYGGRNIRRLLIKMKLLYIKSTAFIVERHLLYMGIRNGNTAAMNVMCMIGFGAQKKAENHMKQAI